MLMIKTLSNISGHLNSGPLPLATTFFIRSVFGHYHLSTCSYTFILVILFCLRTISGMDFFIGNAKY